MIRNKINFPKRSVIFKNWKDDPIDTSGGSRCGKVPFKERDKLSKAQLEHQKNIKCYRLVFGTVSFDGTTADGNKVAIKINLSYGVLQEVILLL